MLAPRSEVDRVADHRELDQLPAADPSRQGYAAVETDADAERRLARQRQLFVVLLEGLAHGERGANGIVGLPWVRLQGAEQSQDAVADELRNVATMLRDGPAHAREVAVQDLDEQRGLNPFAQRGETDDVAEQH